MTRWEFTFGLPETKCGFGSKVVNTVSIRSWLPKVFAELGIASILDAPCGDFNWMSRTDLSSVHYVGVDFDPEHLSLARSRTPDYSPLTKDFMIANIIDDLLPACELILCRDFFQHLPTDQIIMTIANFKRSGARWLCATSHSVDINENLDQPGQFRPFNLIELLSDPIRYIEDGTERILGLWDLENVAYHDLALGHEVWRRRHQET